MNDLELLELAAKAVNGGAWHPLTHGKPWNPLNDDGDALRLAVKLHISIYADDESYVFGVTDRESEMGWCECWNDDPCAAARRAIVRAAANIGASIITSHDVETEIPHR